jgi:uncharacterized protein DUF3943
MTRLVVWSCLLLAAVPLAAQESAAPAEETSVFIPGPVVIPTSLNPFVPPPPRMQAQADSQHAAPDTVGCPDCSPREKRFWLASLELMAVQLLPWSLNHFVRDAEWADISFKTWENNLENPWQWDDNQFLNNQFSHPYHGAMYFNSARANGYSFWGSFAWPFAGSMMWELFGEAWAPSPNDWLNTSLGGISLGESLWRLSSLTLDNTATGSERMWREIGGAALNPVRGFTRLVRGEVNDVGPNPEDARPSRIQAVLDVGYRRISTDGEAGLSEGSADDQWNIGIGLNYGDLLTDVRRSPFSYFQIDAELAGPSETRKLTRLSSRGSLAAWPLDHASRHQFAVLMSYNYFDNPAFTFGGQSGHAGILSLWGDRDRRKFWVQTEVLLTGIAIGATRSDYYHTIEGRNYDYGTGGGAVVNARAYFHHRASLRLGYASFYINTIDGADSKHYQDAFTAEARVRLTHRFGLGALITQYDRTSQYTGLADVTQRSTLARAFISTAIPRLED